MEDWELDRIFIWLWAASNNNNIHGVKFLIDLNDKLLFNLIRKDKEWKFILNQEISVTYSKEDLKILSRKIQSLKNSQNNILEFPKLSELQLENIKKIKQEFEEKRKNNIEFDVMEYNRILYEEPANFEVNWLKALGIEINELSRIGF